MANEYKYVKQEVAEDFKKKLVNLKGKEDLDTRIQLLIGKTTKTLEKLKATDPDLYDLLLENMAMITILHNKNK